jgi:hypothetical protein
MPILSQTLKGHNSETVHPFELKFFVEMHFDQLYLGSTKEVLGIDQSIAIGMLRMPGLDLPTYWLRAGPCTGRYSLNSIEGPGP